VGLSHPRRHTGSPGKPGWEHPANETELLIISTLVSTVQVRQEELPDDAFTESGPPMQSRLICQQENHLHTS